MNLEKSKSMSQAVTDAQAKLDRLLQDQARAERAAQVGDEHAAEIARLEQEREAAIGKAFIEGTAPDVTGLDKAIASAKKKSAEALEAAAAARAALGLLAWQIGDAQQALQDAQRAQLDAVHDDLVAGFTEAQTRYLDAAEGLLDRLAEFEGVARVRDAVARRLGHRKDSGEFVASVVRAKLQLPLRGSGGWWPTGETGARWERHKVNAEKLAARLRAINVEPYGPALIAPPAPTAPAEPRPVRIIIETPEDDEPIVKITSPEAA